MTSSTPMSVFCQWLLADTPTDAPACAIVLHGHKDDANNTLIENLAQYLNEYDEEADGLWLSATDELIRKASSDPSNRRLLGLPDLADPDDACRQEEIIKSLKALGKKGHLVFRCPQEPGTDLTPGRAFHAGIGNHLTIKTPCHICVDPALMPNASIPHIIGDVFLEWFLGSEPLPQDR